MWIRLPEGPFQRDPSGALRTLRALAANASDVRRRQLLLERHREDLLYTLPKSRVGTNFLEEAARTPCFVGTQTTLQTTREPKATTEPTRVALAEAAPVPKNAWRRHRGEYSYDDGPHP